MSNYILFGLFVLLTISCKIEPIETEIPGFGLSPDTLIIEDITGFTYQSLPAIGNHDKLYFGNNDEFDNRYVLFKFSNSAKEKTGFKWEHLIDSLVIIDSIRFSFQYHTDSMAGNPPQYELWYYPEEDSIFNEGKTNYSNWNSDQFSGLKVSSYNSIVTDTTDNELHFFRFDSLTAQNIISEFADSSSSRTFMLNVSNNSSDIFSIYSSESSFKPQFSCYLRYTAVNDSGVTQIDTLIRTFKSIADVSVIKPHTLSPDDKIGLNISLGKGLKSILNIPFNLDSIPSLAVIKSAKLTVFPYDTTNSDSSYENLKLFCYPLIDSLAITQFDSIGEEINSLNYIYPLAVSWSDNRLSIDIHSFLQSVNINTIDNFGIQLAAGINNSPFQTNHFEGRLDYERSPTLRIEYVAP